MDKGISGVLNSETMSRRRIGLLIMALGLAVLSYVAFDLYGSRPQPLHKQLERLWADDIRTLEASKKLPAVWADVGKIGVIPTDPETKEWLGHIQVPLKPNPNGTHTMEVLLVGWEESGKRGVMIQYNIEDAKTKNTLMELGRNLILSAPENGARQ